MPLGAIGEFVLQTVGEVVINVVGYFTGKINVSIFSIGHVQVEPGPSGQLTIPKWHGVNRQPDGTYLLQAETGALVGLVFWAVIAITYVCI